MINEILTKDSIYWFCALTGSGLFAIQFLFSLFGAMANDLDDGSEVDGRFKFLSKQAITGFLMMFGLAGLTCVKEFALPGFYTVLIALLSGTLTMFLTVFLFRSAKKLHSSGTVFRIEDAIGLEAVVYQRILKGGVGKVTVSVHSFTHEIDAIADEEISSFTNVQIIQKTDEKTVFVIKTPSQNVASM